MRFFAGLVLALVLGVMGCSEASGTGGTAGDGGSAGVGGDPFPGNCGAQGQGGGGNYVHPGLYVAFLPGVALPYRACVYVNEDCTELEASTECSIGQDHSQAHFLEVEWTDGRTDMGGECAAAVGVTTDLVSRIPIAGSCSETACDWGFGIELSDDHGAAWHVSGFWSYDDLFMTAQRTTDDGVCRPYFEYDYGVVNDPERMALVPAGYYGPEVVDFDFLPKQVDVTNAPADVMCEATLFHPGGVDYLYCYFKSPLGHPHGCRADSPSSGDIYEGVWSCTATIPQNADPGFWNLWIAHRRTGAQLEVISR